MSQSYILASALIVAASVFNAANLSAADVQLNEIYANTLGADNSSESEYFEIYNPESSPVDISGYSLSIVGAGNLTFVNPTGTIIPAKGYLVYVTNKNVFLYDFPGFDTSLIVDLNWTDPSSLLANGSSNSTISITKPGDPLPFETLTFQGLGETAKTQELIDESLPNEVPGNWQQSLTDRGSPGRRNTHFNPANISISNVERTVQFPTASTPVIINADVTGTAISTVNLYYTTNPGTTYTSVPMTLTSGNTYSVNLGTLANGTIIKYFVEVLATAGKGHYPPFAAPVIFHVDDTPATDADLVINEVMPNPAGADNQVGSEYIEIYNRRSTPINMSFYKLGYTLAATPNGRVFPEGVIIPGNGYLVFAYNKDYMIAQHPSLTTNNIPVVDGRYKFGGLLAAAHNIFLTHANGIFWNGLNWQLPGSPTIDSVQYVAGWPSNTENFSMELKHPSMDNTQIANWALTTIAGGTPGAQNSVYENASINDWSIY